MILPYKIFYATETYITHFLEATRFPEAPVLAGHKTNFTLRPAKSADFQVDRISPPTSVLGQNSAVSADCQVDRIPPPTSQCLGPETTTLIILSYLILSYLIISHLHKNTSEPVFFIYGTWPL